MAGSAWGKARSACVDVGSLHSRTRTSRERGCFARLDRRRLLVLCQWPWTTSGASGAVAVPVRRPRQQVIWSSLPPSLSVSEPRVTLCVSEPRINLPSEDAAARPSVRRWVAGGRRAMYKWHPRRAAATSRESEEGKHQRPPLPTGIAPGTAFPPRSRPPQVISPATGEGMDKSTFVHTQIQIIIIHFLPSPFPPIPNG
jgi:hypothetical protein